MKLLLLFMSLHSSMEDTTRRDTLWVTPDSVVFKIVVTDLKTGRSDTTTSHRLGNGGYVVKKRLWRRWQRKKQ